MPKHPSRHRYPQPEGGNNHHNSMNGERSNRRTRQSSHPKDSHRLHGRASGNTRRSASGMSDSLRFDDMYRRSSSSRTLSSRNVSSHNTSTRLSGRSHTRSTDFNTRDSRRTNTSRSGEASRYSQNISSDLRGSRRERQSSRIRVSSTPDRGYRTGAAEGRRTNRSRHKQHYPSYTHPAYSHPSAQLYAGPSSKRGASASSALEVIGGGLALIGSSITGGLAFLWGKSKALFMVLVCAVIVALGVSIDGLITNGKIYQGVSVGSVDLSNKTIDEAKEAIGAAYTDKLFSTQTFVFQNDEAIDSVVLDRNNIDLDTLTNLIGAEESQDTHTIWLADAITLGAELPVDQLANEAYGIGRQSGLFDRLGAFFGGYTIEPYASYNDILLDTMIDSIEAATGNELVNWGIAINEGIASVTEGHDGYELDKENFVSGLNNLFFNEAGDVHLYSANTPFVEVKIDQQAAQNTCDAVNESLAQGSSFVYENTDVPVDATTLGSWVTTNIDRVGDEYKLNPSIDVNAATTPLVQLLNAGSAKYDVNVSIYEQDGHQIVKPSESVVIPSAESSLHSLDESLFKAYRETGKTELNGSQFNIPVNSENFDGTFSVQDALAYGIIEVFSSYTTNYSTKASNANRIYNIHLVSDLLNNTIVGAYGGTWSFNTIVGDTTEEAGFREAGSIIENERTDAIGGGVCQVATTVFNAVYDSGLPINQRHNHSLYMSAYPDGRDAAVSFPLLDLIWENDTASDILVTTSYTESSVTVNLIGVNPQYSVETEVGQWQEGEKYTTKTEVDETMEKDAYTIDTHGEDGKVIEVKRTVKDKNGAIIREKNFVSVYSPVTQIVKVGPDSNTAEILKKFDRDDEEDKQGDSNTSSSGSKANTNTSSGSSGSSSLSSSNSKASSSSSASTTSSSNTTGSSST